MSSRQPRFNQQVLVDTTPLPSHIPRVPELGASSAPLLSASFFIGARCKPYNDDFMHCKTEANGKGETDCLREGRKVTRCAASVIDDINASCLNEFRAHWQCLDDNNQQLWQCRGWERLLNSCVFANLNLEKKIPGAPENEVPVHMRKKQIFAHSINPFPSGSVRRVSKEDVEELQKSGKIEGHASKEAAKEGQS